MSITKTAGKICGGTPMASSEPCRRPTSTRIGAREKIGAENAADKRRTLTASLAGNSERHQVGASLSYQSGYHEGRPDENCSPCGLFHPCRACPGNSDKLIERWLSAQMLTN
jgi:hypothetical protein